MQAVVLASGSQYRAQLLSRLGIAFTTLSPDIDESPLPGELPAPMAQRLAGQKAATAAQALSHGETSVNPFSDAVTGTIIIASDQVAACDHRLLGKPGNAVNACSQLLSMSGRPVEFFTSLHMLDVTNGREFTAMDITRVMVRRLDRQSVERYVAKDNPIDCAGSFKVESLGISLFQSVSTDDPTALTGLPLIKVCEGLRCFGWSVP